MRQTIAVIAAIVTMFCAVDASAQVHSGRDAKETMPVHFGLGLGIAGRRCCSRTRCTSDPKGLLARSQVAKRRGQGAYAALTVGLSVREACIGVGCGGGLPMFGAVTAGCSYRGHKLRTAFGGGITGPAGRIEGDLPEPPTTHRFC